MTTARTDAILLLTVKQMRAHMKLIRNTVALILNAAILATCAYLLGFHIGSNQPASPVDQEAIERAVLAAIMEG